MGTRQKGHSPGRTTYLTLDRTWVAAAVLVPTLATLLRRMGAIDLAYHVRLGQEMLSSGHLVRTDTMTFTAVGEAWVDQQWGAEILLALLHRLGGWATVAVGRTLLTGLTFSLVYLACKRRGADARAASLLTLASFVVVLPALAMRPQMFAVPLLATTLWILAGRRDRPASLRALPPIALVWANLHGSFFLLPLAVALAVLEELTSRSKDHDQISRLVSMGILSVGATAVTPFGLGVWRYVLDLGTDPVVRRTITEWAPLSLSGYAGWTFFGSVLLVGGFLAKRGLKTSWGDLAWLGTFLLLALPAVRGMLWWGLVAPVIVAGMLPAAEEQGSRDGSRLVNSVVVGSLLVANLAFLPWWSAGDEPQQVRRSLSDAPIGASDAIERSLPPGSRLAVPQRWGSWFEYAVPEMQVFVDSRIELFPRPIWEDYWELTFAGAGWREVAERWEVRAIVLDIGTNDDLLDLLDAEEGWKPIYEDGEAAVFVRA